MIVSSIFVFNVSIYIPLIENLGNSREWFRCNSADIPHWRNWIQHYRSMSRSLVDGFGYVASRQGHCHYLTIFLGTVTIDSRREDAIHAITYIMFYVYAYLLISWAPLRYYIRIDWTRDFRVVSLEFSSLKEKKKKKLLLEKFYIGTTLIKRK